MRIHLCHFLIPYPLPNALWGRMTSTRIKDDDFLRDVASCCGTLTSCRLSNTDTNRRCLAHVISTFSHMCGPCRREEKRLPVRWNLTRDCKQMLFKASIKHPISFVKHEEDYAAHIYGALTHKLHHSAWGTNNNLPMACPKFL